MKPPSRRKLNIAWLAGLGLAALGTGLSAANGRPPEVFLPVGISGAVYVTSGYAMARSRPANPIGYALMLVVVFEAGLVALRHLIPPLEVLNEALSPISALLIAYVLLAYPTGSLERVERVALTTIASVFAILAVAILVTVEPSAHETTTCPPCGPNPFRITDLSVFLIVTQVQNIAILGSALAVSALCVRRWLRARGPGRRVLAPVLFAGIVTAVAFAIVGLVFATGGFIPLWRQALFLIQILIPIGLAVTFVRVYAARGAVASAIVQLGASPSSEGLEEALRRSLGDPALVVARWSDAAGAYLDREGHRVDLDDLAATRAAMRLERDGRPLAAVVHDAALEVDPRLVETVADAVRFAVDTTDLRDRLLAHGGDQSVLPRGEVTFLFGDVEGSTELLARLGDAYVHVLAELRRIVRDEADRNAGQVVDVRADECFLAFPRPGGGLGGAVGIQRRMRGATWPNGEQPLLRIGLHMGTPELTTDGYVGMDVHRAARVMAAAHGGQILASSPVATAVGDHVPAGVAIVPLGYYRLRGIAEPEFLYRISGGTGASELPPRAEPG